MRIRNAKTGHIHDHTTITRVIVYGDGVKLYQTDNYYLEEIRLDTNGKTSSVYDGRPSCITLSEEPKNARKENLNRKDNFLLSYSKPYGWNERGLALYIHCSEIGVKTIGEAIAIQANGETNYKTVYELTFTHGAEMTRCKIETVENAGSDFTPPEGCRWSRDYSRNPAAPNYDIISGGIFEKETRVVKRWLEKETVYKMLVDSDQYTRTEKDDGRKKREDIAAFINEKKIFHREVSHYEIERLLQYFDLTTKEGVTK